MERDDERRALGRSDDTRRILGSGEPGPAGDPGMPAQGGVREEYVEETIRVRRAGEPAPAPAGQGDDRTPRAGGGSGGHRDPWAIRAEDTEPYVGLQYVARLFKIVAMVVIVALVAEVVAGIAYEGAGAILQLFTEVIQGGVLAAMLWGASDLTLLFIDVGHDVRAQRVLLGRLTARAGSEYPAQRRGGQEPEQRERER